MEELEAWEERENGDFGWRNDNIGENWEEWWKDEEPKEMSEGIRMRGFHEFELGCGDGNQWDSGEKGRLKKNWE